MQTNASEPSQIRSTSVESLVPSKKTAPKCSYRGTLPNNAQGGAGERDFKAGRGPLRPCQGSTNNHTKHDQAAVCVVHVRLNVHTHQVRLSVRATLGGHLNVQP